MMRVPAYFWSGRRSTRRSRASDEPGGARRARLEPRVLVGGVVDDELGDDLQPAPVRFAHERAEVVARAVVRMHVVVVGDVVAVVAQRRRIERQQPDRVDAELLDVVELVGQPAEVADAVVVRVEERLDVQLVDDRVLVPERIACGRGRGVAGAGDVAPSVSVAIVVMRVRTRRRRRKMCAGQSRCGSSSTKLRAPVPE